MAKAKGKSPFKKGRMSASSSGGGKFVSIKDGESLTMAFLHGLDEMISADMHEYWDIRPAVFHPCIGPGCPGCAAGNKIRQKGYMGVVDREGNPMVFPFTSSVFKQIEALEDSLKEDAEDSEDPLRGFVFKFTRNGSGLNTKYAIIGVGKYIDVEGVEMPEIIDHLGETDKEKIQAKLEEAGLLESDSDDKFGGI